MEKAVSISGLVLSYGERTLFRNFSIEIEAGKNIVITAASGSGKTSLLNCLMGFVLPDEGQISIMSIPLDSDTVWTARKYMTMVQQEPEPGQGTISSMLNRPFRYHANRDIEFDQQHCDQLMDKFRLPRGLLDKTFQELSGGEKQRVSLVSALMLKRKILLLDEITSALDEDNKQAIVEHLATLTDTTIIASAHDAVMCSLADQVVSLDGEDSR